MADSPKSIPAEEYEPSSLGSVMETSLLGSLHVAADRIRIFHKMAPEASDYEVSKATDTTIAQVQAALKAER